MTHRDIRVGYTERDETTARLAEHFAAGRLNRAEFDERTSQALAARTRGELDDVMSDLPSVPVVAQEPPPTAPVPSNIDAKQAAISHWRRTTLATWAIFAVFFIVLWAVTGVGYFWPVWPIMGWGLGVAISGVKAHTEEPPSPEQPQLPGPEHRGGHHGHL